MHSASPIGQSFILHYDCTHIFCRFPSFPSAKFEFVAIASVDLPGSILTCKLTSAITMYIQTIFICRHHDDGPDKPYYTIKYAKPDVQVDENNGSETVMQCTVEKQTTPDRLDRLPWDEIKAWDAIQQK